MAWVMSAIRVASAALAATFVAAATPSASASVLGCSASATAEIRASEMRELMAKHHRREVEAVVAAWYAELRKGEAGDLVPLLAPQTILEHCRCEAEVETQPRYFVSPFTSELAYRSLRFSYEIEKIKVDPSFARVQVRERGWNYAWSAEETYENDADTIFMLERGTDGRWLIAAFAARGSAVRPDDAKEPMPDLKDEYFKRFPNPE